MFLKRCWCCCWCCCFFLCLFWLLFFDEDFFEFLFERGVEKKKAKETSERGVLPPKTEVARFTRRRLHKKEEALNSSSSLSSLKSSRLHYFRRKSSRGVGEERRERTFNGAFSFSLAFEANKNTSRACVCKREREN